MAAHLIFPLDLNNPDSSEAYQVAMKRPMVVFTQNMVKVTSRDGDRGGFAVDTNNNPSNTRIYLPIPQSIAVSDKADYTAKALGMAGKAVTQGLGGKSWKDAADAVEKSVTGMGINALLASVVNALGSKVSPEVTSAANIGSGTVPNPYLMTEFTGVETRQFTFNFKMIPTSAAEAKMIKDIIYAFRLGLYPKSNIFQLTYPPTWTIRFIAHDPQDSSLTDIDYLPRIFETFLVDAQATFNAAGNMWRVDGAPLETDLALSFMETRALTNEDITKLNIQSYSKAAFDLPSSSSSNLLTPNQPASGSVNVNVNGVNVTRINNDQRLPAGTMSTVNSGSGVTGTSPNEASRNWNLVTGSFSNGTNATPPSPIVPGSVRDVLNRTRAAQDAIDVSNGLLPNDW